MPLHERLRMEDQEPGLPEGLPEGLAAMFGIDPDHIEQKLNEVKTKHEMRHEAEELRLFGFFESLNDEQLEMYMRITSMPAESVNIALGIARAEHFKRKQVMPVEG